ncbi:MAG: DUF2232 domain-containing protein [Magnetococcales bacterium]|nr:DUF2232 domain-containing protein [Magnetococcales bacterium]MBF0156646.1 DUF2232 domain-containing protein [Magnetococcales bacterium]
MLGRLTQGPAGAGGLSLLLLVGALALPIPFLPLSLLVPLPLLLVGLRGGVGVAAQAVMPLVIVSFFLKPGLVLPLTVFLYYGGFPILATWLIHGGWKVSQLLSIVFVVTVAAFTLLVFLSALVDLPIDEVVGTRINEVRDELIASTEAIPELDAMAKAEARKLFEALAQSITLLFPGAFMAGWFAMQSGNLVLAQSAISRREGSRLIPEDWTRLRLPFALIWGVITMAVLAFIGSGWVRYLGLNLGLFLALPYFFQGLAILQASFRLYRVPGLLRGTLYATMLIWTEVLVLMVFLGLFDTWVDFRRRFRLLPEEDGTSARED